jgi:hypothetical protein
VTLTDAGLDNASATGSSQLTSLVASCTVGLTLSNDTPTVSGFTFSYTDTTGDDSFSDTVGTLSASDVETNRSDLRFTLTGATSGSWTWDGVSYDQSKLNQYSQGGSTYDFGTLYLNTTTGNYRFKPNDTGIEQLFTNSSTTWSVQVRDNDPTPKTSGAATITLNISATDDTNLITLGGINAFTEQTATTLMPNAIVQADRDGLQELKVQIENNKVGDTLSATVGATGITASFNSATGTLTLSKSGGGSAEAFQQVLRTVVFNNASDAPDPELRRLVVSTGAVVPYFSHPDNYVRYYEYVSAPSNITW